MPALPVLWRFKVSFGFFMGRDHIVEAFFGVAGLLS